MITNMDRRADLAMSDNKRNYASELWSIKTLFLQRQYRQCINAGREALKSVPRGREEQHVLRAASLEFYIGLAHDELARLMHEQSQIRIPTFSEAEKYYRQALKSLPTTEQCKRHMREVYRYQEAQLALEQRQAFHEPESEASNYSPTTPPLPSSPPFWFSSERERNPIAYSPVTLRHEPASDASDMSSHGSFDEIMTPNRLVKRDVSQMSLLANPLPRDYSSMSLIDRKPSLHRSTSQGLLRPIRPGSPPKPFHLPPKMPYIGQRQSASRIPQLPKLHITDSPTKRSHSGLMPEQEGPSPVSPVSPMESGDESDACDLSPVSARTPTPLPSPLPDDLEDCSFDFSRVEIHLTAFRAQLQRHLFLAQSARLATTIAQNERAARSSPVSNYAPATSEEKDFQSPTSSVQSRARGGKGSIAQARSFWSFKPEDVKADELRRRIELRRKQGWQRERFRPEKYQDLADRALAEL